MDPREILKSISTPKELLRVGAVGFGVLGGLQVAGRPDLVGAEPVLGPWASLGLALACLILLEVYAYAQRRLHLEEQEEVARRAAGSEPPGGRPYRGQTS